MLNYKKIIIVITVIGFKISIWFLFQEQMFFLSKYICENLEIVSKEKKDLFNGVPEVIIILKFSFLLVNILCDLIILGSFKLQVLNLNIYKRFIKTYLFINFILLIFILSIIK
ncbi:conserved membrane hypothetical protein [Flavobacterium sp. 9AF]|uniref:hypothetical protein n=1 Tax=Flavobacterium sp. 9AF TaxID=2653142 RepID=UPI0012F3CFD4|nr:hypothetical protein [Flavobacterium sp. 9AF]VXB33189.1 conserved membrane hypothetical protein [Flavobacterium sp. 9AF]